MADLTAETFKTKLQEYHDKVEVTVKKIVANGSVSDTVMKDVEDMKLNMAEFKTAIAEIDAAIKERNQLKVPGLPEHIKDHPFLYSAFIGAAYKQKVGNMSKEEAWKDAGNEQEILRTKDQNRYIQKDGLAGDGTQGGYIIPPEATTDFVDMTLADMPLMSMGVNKITGLYGPLTIPRQTGRNTAYWVGEIQEPTKSSVTYDQFTLSPKKLAALTEYSNDLAYQSRGVQEAVVTQSMKDAMSLELENGLLNGLGTERQPRGFFNHRGFTTGPTEATNGARFVIDKGARMVQNISVANELKQSGTHGFLMRPEVLGGMMRERVKNYAAQNIGEGMPATSSLIMSKEEIERWLGYKIGTTTIISGEVDKGSSSTCSKVAFGNWKQFYIGFWRGLEMKVSDVATDTSGVSAFTQDMIFVRTIQQVDCNIGRASAFTVVSDAETVFE